MRLGFVFRQSHFFLDEWELSKLLVVHGKTSLKKVLEQLLAICCPNGMFH